MRVEKSSTRETQFYLPDLDTPILVESNEDGSVVIRAARNNVSGRRKTIFIRQLATEGFIPETYQSMDDPVGSGCGLTWVVDHSWLKLHPAVRRTSTRFMKRLFVGAALLWFAMMGLAFLAGRSSTASHSPHRTAPTPAAGYLGRDNR